MKKLTLWMMAAILCCSPLVFTSCTQEDNPVDNPPKEEKNADRAAFENILSDMLARGAQDVRFESAIVSTQSLADFLTTLDENALKEQIGTFLTKVAQGGKNVEMKSLSAEEKQAVEKCLKDRFNMSDEELASTSFFLHLDAYKTLNKLHLTFENGKCTSSEDAEGFTVEIVKSATERSKFRIEFGDGENGLSFFPTRIGGVVPIALKVPKSFNVSMTTARGNVMNGVIELSSKASSEYISIKSDNWNISALLAATVNGRDESIAARLTHENDGNYDAEASIGINDKTVLAIAAHGLKPEYTKEYIDSDELKQLRDMGPFFAAGYEVLKALKGKTLDELSITIHDDLVISGNVDDAAKSLLALGKIRHLYGTQPGFEAVDAYTQELNKYVHFTIYQKSTDITAQGSLLTIQKGSKNEYQPVLALTFKGETKAQSMYENMTEEDKANYNKIMQNLNGLLKECTTLVENLSGKVKSILSAFKL